MVVDGLQSGTTYCFSVRALGKDGSSAPSPVHCHATREQTGATTNVPVSVVTYNVCGTARGCGSWTKRRDAVLQQINRSRADIVALQETGRRRTTLLGPMRKRGFEQIVYSRDEVLYARTSRFDLNVGEELKPVCRDEPYTNPATTSQWKRERRFFHWDGASRTYYVLVGDQWYASRASCPQETVRVQSYTGYFPLAHGREVQTAVLYDRLTGRSALVANTHLSNGRTRQASRQRRLEVARLLDKIAWLRPGRSTIVVGDFNSDATHADDVVGTAMKKAGFRDAFQNSATYTRPQLNSFNGYRRIPHRNDRWGGHIDRIFTSGSVVATDWEIVARTAKGRYAGRWASDHNPVRVSLRLP